MKYSQTPQFSANFHNSNQGSVTTKYLLIGSGLFLALIITAVGFIFALRELNSARDNTTEETSSITEEEADDNTQITSEKMLEILADMDITCEENDLDSLAADIREYLQSEANYEFQYETNIDNFEKQLRADYQGPGFVCSDTTNNAKYDLITKTDDLLLDALKYEYDQQTDPITDEEVCEYSDDPQKLYDIYAEIGRLAFDDWVISPDSKDYKSKRYQALSNLDSLKAEFAKQNLMTKKPETIKVCG